MNFWMSYWTKLHLKHQYENVQYLRYISDFRLTPPTNTEDLRLEKEERFSQQHGMKRRCTDESSHLPWFQVDLGCRWVTEVVRGFWCPEKTWRNPPTPTHTHAATAASIRHGMTLCVISGALRQLGISGAYTLTWDQNLTKAPVAPIGMRKGIFYFGFYVCILIFKCIFFNDVSFLLRFNKSGFQDRSKKDVWFGSML